MVFDWEGDAGVAAVVDSLNHRAYFVLKPLLVQIDDVASKAETGRTVSRR